ncbi:MAG: fimbrillin family protein [Rikenellaceae bacterium]
MIKIYSALLVSLFFIVGCTQHGDVDTTICPDDNLCVVIDFEQQTKGVLVGSLETMGSIGVYCAYTQDADWSEQTQFGKMYNERLDYDADLMEWVYDSDDIPTWGHTSFVDKYTFMGYSPFGDDDNNITSEILNGDLIVEYVVPNKCTQQPDLMMAIPRKNIYPQVSGAVTLNFKHTLAAIGFSVKGVDTEIVKRVTVKGVVASGKVSISDSGVVSWDLGSRTDVSYSAKIDRDVEPNVDTAQELTLSNGYLMMIPQECSDVELEVTIYDTESESTTTKTFSLGAEDQWVCGKIYNYTFVLSDYDYTIEGTSNCYMLHPDGCDQEFYIPVEGRINTFWRDYVDDNNTYENMLSSTDEWEAELLWSDFNGNTTGFKVERVTSGFSSNDSVTPFSEPNFTTPGARSAMKITLPSNISEGNFLVAVSFGGRILWSWHLWVTEYNPDLIAANSSATQGKYVYTYDSVEGEVHRYDTDGLWSTLYNNSFIMDRNLGARDSDYAPNRDGVLHYQFGRKDPFPASSSLSPSIVDDCVSFATSVQNPTSFYIRKTEEYSWSQEGLEMGSKYLWFDKSVVNDPNASGKSIFDPSPLGWRVPRYRTFEAMNYGNCEYDSRDNILLYNSAVKLPMTGYRSNKVGSVNDYGDQGNIRVSTQINSSSAYNFVYNPYVYDTNNTLADGFCVRCIEE